MHRHTTLDAIRGVAVMGILLANIVAFGLPEAAYFSPLAWGGSTGADRVAWFLNYLLVEGRLRGLFSFLFGASMLLVIERAEASGDAAGPVHLARMFWLFVIGCIHLYLFWWGDILAHYAVVGTIAFVFHRLDARMLVVMALAFFALTLLQGVSGAATLFASAARRTVAERAVWDAVVSGYGVPPASRLAAEIAAIRGGFWQAAALRWETVLGPLLSLPLLGADTLSAILLGMAGYRSGFLTGGWSGRAYRRIAIGGIGVATLGYGAMGVATMRHGFDVRFVYVGAHVVTVPFRLAGTLGYAALLVLLLREGSAATTRLAAVGRMAFSNYLGTTLLMDLVFCGWGLGLFARLDRATLYLLVPAAWLVMLIGSPWWLRRFAYGPFEWLWRSLARAEWQRLRRAS